MRLSVWTVHPVPDRLQRWSLFRDYYTDDAHAIEARLCPTGDVWCPNAARLVATLYKAAPNARYVTFVNANADSIWANDQGTEYQLGGLWQGPFDSADATAQTSALDALIAATELNNTTSNSSLRHADDPNNK
jgi:protein-disulfide isomerase